MRDYRRYYHIGIMKDYRHPKTVIVQMRENKDCLDCELWRYYGVRYTTKAFVNLRKSDLLAAINTQFMQYFTKIIID